MERCSSAASSFIGGAAGEVCGDEGYADEGGGDLARRAAGNLQVLLGNDRLGCILKLWGDKGIFCISLRLYTINQCRKYSTKSNTSSYTHRGRGASYIHFFCLYLLKQNGKP